jgi:hypothetical protein
MSERRSPGSVRDAILAAFKRAQGEMTTGEIYEAVRRELGSDVPASSVRSYLNINTPGLFIRTGYGKYRLVRR